MWSQVFYIGDPNVKGPCRALNTVCLAVLGSLTYSVRPVIQYPGIWLILGGPNACILLILRGSYACAKQVERSSSQICTPLTRYWRELCRERAETKWLGRMVNSFSFLTVPWYCTFSFPPVSFPSSSWFFFSPFLLSSFLSISSLLTLWFFLPFHFSSLVLYPLSSFLLFCIHSPPVSFVQHKYFVGKKTKFLSQKFSLHFLQTYLLEKLRLKVQRKVGTFIFWLNIKGFCSKVPRRWLDKGRAQRNIKYRKQSKNIAFQKWPANFSSVFSVNIVALSPFTQTYANNRQLVLYKRSNVHAPLTNVSQTFSLDNESLGWCVPWMMCPCSIHS